jgi:peptidoglycan/xylan/chitin deacetylase (PgdA/CDA1 family)
VVTATGVGLASADAAEDDRPHPPHLTNTLASREAAQPDGVFRVDVDEPIVALSFDDGPDPKYTPHVLDLLARHGLQATFFLVGVNAARYTDLVAQHRGAGHSIGNHTYDHAELERLDPTHVQAEIDRGAFALAAAGAGAVRLFRPPKGHTDSAVAVLADADRYRTIFWDQCVERWVDPLGVRRGVSELLDRVRPGSIIVAHDGGHVVAPHHPHLNRSKTMEALPLLLAGLHRKGLRVVDVPTLLRKGHVSRRR